MLRRFSSHLTYANVMATVAVFIALGGVSYAAVKLPKNSVGSTQIKKNSVTGSKVKSSSLTGSDIKNSSLTGSDLKNSSVTGSDVKDGSLTAKDFSGSVQGAQGPAGAQGPKGDPGAKGDAGPQGPGARDFIKSIAKSAGFVELATLENGLKVVGLCAGAGVSATVETTSGATTFEGSGMVSRRSPAPETYPVVLATGVSNGTGFPLSNSAHLDTIARDSALGGRLAHVIVGGSFDNATGCQFWGTITPTT